MKRLVLSLAISLAGLAIVSQAQAALGGKLSSVDADRAQFNARMISREAPNYTVHEMSLGTGTVTREYTLSDGTVFAVSWRGPVRPNLKQLFGDYYDRFQADNTARPRFRLHRPMVSDHLDFQARTGGHSGAFWGYAILPQSVPAGFSGQALQP